MAFGTPWPGSERVAANQGGELRALAFLHQAAESRLRRLSPEEALDQLVPVASILWYDMERMARSVKTCKLLLDQVPAYELHFRNTPDVHDLITELWASTPPRPLAKPLCRAGH
jgi:hypothetical protein